MKLKNRIFILLYGLCIDCEGYASESPNILFSSQTSIKETPLSSIISKSPLTKDLESIWNDITRGHNTSSPKLLRTAYKKFKILSYSEQEWEEAAKKEYAASWPSQKTFKERVGALFFYPVTFAWLFESPYTEACLQAPVMLQAFEISARFRHSLGLYYLAYTLDNIYSDTNDEKRPEIKQAYQVALKELQQCTDNPAVCYVLGRNYTEDSYKVRVLEINPQLACKLLEKGDDNNNQFAALTIREKMKGFKIPSYKEYKKFAKHNCYGPAYVKLSILNTTFEKKVRYLDRAIKKTHMKAAFIDKGLLYLQNGNREEAIKSFLKAGKEGIAEGYINLGILKVGDLLILPRQSISDTIERTSPKEIQEAIQAFELAGKLHYAKGWDYLAILYIELYKKTREEPYGHKLRSCLVEGIKDNSFKAYELMKVLFPEDFSSLKTPLFQKCYSNLAKLLKQY
ncbi:MAG: hypothetical protein K0M45_03855 [Candidatus Paracaedibacteraceae bacterium]|nr:hypothetical protein [Candidatus Paracaedibacteraceae bacterium]